MVQDGQVSLTLALVHNMYNLTARVRVYIKMSASGGGWGGADQAWKNPLSSLAEDYFFGLTLLVISIKIPANLGILEI